MRLLCLAIYLISIAFLKGQYLRNRVPIAWVRLGTHPLKKKVNDRLSSLQRGPPNDDRLRQQYPVVAVMKIVADRAQSHRNRCLACQMTNSARYGLYDGDVNANADALVFGANTNASVPNGYKTCCCYHHGCCCCCCCRCTCRYASNPHHLLLWYYKWQPLYCTEVAWQLANGCYVKTTSDHLPGPGVYNLPSVHRFDSSPYLEDHCWSTEAE